ncbi:nucleotidyltransferase domain-containing protein [Ensifer adhaerens]|uniref:nucleotidyltransferase domain-containing protein n=1 Tax=Ensifer adhaerens TaxID=106592 RepID=UPI000CF0C2E1|nr:nucleotidyltransferase domain-containing protein [Ensifer adhaerens]
MARSERESAIRYPLTWMLGVDSNLRVLRTLVRHGGVLAASDIVRMSRLSRESVRLGLLALGALGIVDSLGSINARVHRLNELHYLAPVLTMVFKAEAERFEAILSAVCQSAIDKPVLSLFLYGSAARGDDMADSDLDIGLVARPGDLADVVEGLRDAVRGPAEYLSFRPSVVGLDIEDFRRLTNNSDPWLENVKREAIVLLGRRLEEL